MLTLADIVVNSSRVITWMNCFRLRSATFLLAAWMLKHKNTAKHRSQSNCALWRTLTERKHLFTLVLLWPATCLSWKLLECAGENSPVKSLLTLELWFRYLFTWQFPGVTGARGCGTIVKTTDKVHQCVVTSWRSKVFFFIINMRSRSLCSLHHAWINKY